MGNYVETVSDYQIKYSDTYVRVPEFSLPKLKGAKFAPICRLSNRYYDEDGEEVCEEITSVHYVEAVLFGISEENYFINVEKIEFDSIDFTPLELGAINLELSTVNILSTLPDGVHKYRKLPSKGSIALIDPFLNERKMFSSDLIVCVENYDLFNAWYNNKYVNAQTALDNVFEGKRLSQAFNSEFSFGMNLATNSIALYYNGTPFLKVSDEKEILVPKRFDWIVQEMEYFGLLTKIY